MKKEEFFQVLDRLYSGDYSQFLRELRDAVDGKNNSGSAQHLSAKPTGILKIFTPNPEQIMLAHEDAAFFTELLQGDLLLPDGTQLVRVAKQAQRAGKIAQVPSQRITGVDVLTSWLTEGKQHGLSTLLLGGKTGVASALARKMDPDGIWCFGSEGYASVSHPTDTEEKELRALVARVHPRMLFVAFGAPLQERWVLKNARWLEESGVRAVMVCGGAVDVLSPASRLQRAPLWMQNFGLEWLFRLVQEPGRWKRQQKVLEFIQFSNEWIRN